MFDKKLEKRVEKLESIVGEKREKKYESTYDFLNRSILNMFKGDTLYEKYEKLLEDYKQIRSEFDLLIKHFNIEKFDIVKEEGYRKIKKVKKFIKDCNEED